MRIVCGTDFSEGSAPALAAMRALAQRCGDREPWLVHVLDPATMGFEAKERGIVEDAARRRLEAQAAQLAEGTDLQVRTAVERGSASASLLEFAEAHGAGLVVVASTGHSRSSLFRLGGTSERLAQSTEVPLLVVRDGRPFEAWGRGERPLRVYLGVDESPSSDPAIRWLKALREAGPCDVVVGHVYYASEARRRYGLPPHGPQFERDPEVEALLERDLAARVGDLGGQGAVEYRPTAGFGRTGDHLLEAAEAERADLVVVGSNQPRGPARWTSVSSVALRYAHASVAVVPRFVGVPVVESIPPVNRVLVATDLSPFADRAVPLAYGLSSAGGEVFLVHVLPEQATSPDEETNVVAELRARVPRGAEARGIVTRTVVVRGDDVPRAILEASERLGADVVCVASHGRGGLLRTVLGSVAEAVLRQSRRPVLVLRPPPG